MYVGNNLSKRSRQDISGSIPCTSQLKLKAMKKKTLKRLIAALIILTMLSCIYVFQDENGNVEKIVRAIWLKLGYLALSILFVRRMYRIYKECGWGVLRKMWGNMILIFIGGGWLLEVSAAITGATLATIISALKL